MTNFALASGADQRGSNRPRAKSVDPRRLAGAPAATRCDGPSVQGVRSGIEHHGVNPDRKHRQPKAFLQRSLGWGVYRTAHSMPKLLLFESSHPLVIRIMQGSATVTIGRKCQELAEGGLVLVPENEQITLETSLGQNRCFEALSLTVSRACFETSYQHHALLASQRYPKRQTMAATADICFAFDQVVDAMQGVNRFPETILHHRSMELVLWLAESGVFLPWQRKAAFSERIVSLVSSDLSHAWSVVEVGNHLAVSQATLRRKLRSEGTSFRQLLLQHRMERARLYLRSTNWNLTRVSAAVGYSSVPRFISRFVQEYGAHPDSFR